MRKNKFQIVLLAIMALLMGLLITVTLITKQNGYEKLLMVSPKLNKDSGTDVDKLEQINGNNFLVTYEVDEDKQIQVHNIRHSVILKGTNYTYPFVMHYTFASGSFFTRTVQEQKLKSVVLNEAAAFEMFGSFHIAGKKILLDDVPYTITGVIRDGAEEKNIYMPVTLMDKQPDTFMAGLDPERGITQEYIKTTFKEAGITETDYDFINLDEAVRKMEAETGITLLSVFAFLLLLKLRDRITKLSCRVGNLRELSKQYYYKELVHENPGVILGMALNCLSIVFYITMLGSLLKNSFETGLNMNLSGNILTGFDSGCFFNKVQFIQYNFLYSVVFFSGYMLLFVIFAVSIWEKTSK